MNTNKRSFSVGKALDFAVNEFKRDPWVWIIAGAIFTALGFGANVTFNRNFAHSLSVNQNVNMQQQMELEEMMEEYQEEMENNPGMMEMDGQMEQMQRMQTEGGRVNAAMDERNAAAIGIAALVGVLGIFFLSFMAIVVVLYTGLTLGSYRLVLDALDGKKLQLSVLFSMFKPSWILRGLGLGICVALLVAIGFILLIIPGVYLAIKYGFAQIFMVDKNAGISDSMKGSAELTKGVKLKLFGVGLLAMLVSGFGGVTIIGNIFILPILMLMSGHIYRQLLSGPMQTAAVNAPVAPTPHPVSQPQPMPEAAPLAQ